MNETKSQKFADFLAEEAKSLLIEHIESAEAAAVDGIDPADDKPVKAKVSISFAWDAGAQAPNVVTKLTYTTSHKDETERTFDPDQMTFSAELEARIEGMGGQKNVAL